MLIKLLCIVVLIWITARAESSVNGGGCSIPSNWTGRWFQSGVQGLTTINTTHIDNKGECIKSLPFNQFVFHDRTDGCYRCLVIHEKHPYVLQYKETYCSALSDQCDMISGDSPDYFMFRKEPTPLPQPCPFRQAPFTFTYNSGAGECAYPLSTAESLDTSRLLLKFIACPDLMSSETIDEELVCLGTWTDGPTKYLLGHMNRWPKNSIISDEDALRCFVYKGRYDGKITSYIVSQSAEATCSGMTTITDGVKTMRFTGSPRDAAAH